MKIVHFEHVTFTVTALFPWFEELFQNAEESVPRWCVVVRNFRFTGGIPHHGPRTRLAMYVHVVAAHPYVCVSVCLCVRARPAQLVLLANAMCTGKGQHIFVKTPVELMSLFHSCSECRT